MTAQLLRTKLPVTFPGFPMLPLTLPGLPTLPILPLIIKSHQFEDTHGFRKQPTAGNESRGHKGGGTKARQAILTNISARVKADVYSPTASQSDESKVTLTGVSRFKYGLIRSIEVSGHGNLVASVEWQEMHTLANIIGEEYPSNVLDGLSSWSSLPICGSWQVDDLVCVQFVDGKYSIDDLALEFQPAYYIGPSQSSPSFADSILLLESFYQHCSLPVKKESIKHVRRQITKRKDLRVHTSVCYVNNQYAVSPYSMGVVINQTSSETFIRLPSGEVKNLPNTRYCHVGVAAGNLKTMAKQAALFAGGKHKRLYKKRTGKAGYSRLLGKRPTVRGVARNPVDHPHGGGEGKSSGGRPSVTPWGKPAKGQPTVKKKKNK